MNMTVKQLFISKIIKHVRYLSSFAQQVVLNLMEMIKQVSFVIEKIIVSLFSVMILTKDLFSEPTITCSSTLTTISDITTGTMESMSINISIYCLCLAYSLALKK